jgi:rare lipoprotein A
LACLAALGAGCLVLANCSGGPGRIDPKYGVTASERVVDIGERAPKGGGVYKVGKPYTVAGRTYVPATDVKEYREVGYASWYGDDFHGRYTANGEVFDMESISAASPVLPLPSYVRVTNLANNRTIVVRVNDRGPFAKDRILDVSRRTAKLLGFHDRGVTKVRVEYVGRAPLKGSSDRELVATLRHHGPGEAGPVRVAANERFTQTYFDSRPLGGVLPPSRPFGQNSARHAAVAETAPSAAPTTELAAAARIEQVPLPSPERQMTARAAPGVSPVSAYAPVRYDAPAAGFMSGRGLY